MSDHLQIRKMIEAYQSMVMARQHLGKLSLRIEEERQACAELRELLEKEYEDIEALEKSNLPRLFSSMLKNDEEQMEIEKQEYLHAAIKYKEANQMLELLEFERKVLEEKLLKERAVKEELDAALRYRSRQISQEYPGLISELSSLDLRADQQMALVRELREAIIVGAKVLQLLQKMVEQLGKVREWGLWNSQDQQSARQEAWIDQAQQLSYQIKQLLQEFEDELEDIYKFQRIKGVYRFEELTHFTDIYTNRLISDWIVRKKIQASLSNVQAVQDSITRIVQSLKQEVKQAEISIGYLQEQRVKVILGLEL